MDSQQIRIKPAILGIKSTVLQDDERELFQDMQPLGFILFSRNLSTPDQIKRLIEDLRSTVNHQQVPILIDEEGGRVSRLPKEYYEKLLPALNFGTTYLTNSEIAKNILHNKFHSLSEQLVDLGFNVNTTPCMDITRTFTHNIIGNRSFAAIEDNDSAHMIDFKMKAIIDLSFQCIKTQYEAGILSVMKHIPGHGVANADSHEKLPVCGQSIQELKTKDFLVFKEVCSKLTREAIPHPWGMTAHIVYNDLSTLPATHSPNIINQIIRQFIGFDGFLISDGLEMHALHGHIYQRAITAIKAGCDAVLHCNGNFDEMSSMLHHIPYITAKSYERFLTSWNFAHTMTTYTSQNISYDNQDNIPSECNIN